MRRTGDSTGSVGEFARELTTGLKYLSRKSDEMSKEGIEMIKVIFSAIFEATLKNLAFFKNFVPSLPRVGSRVQLEKHAITG